ncbi:MAG TPA: MBL fold metallo-hydrolase [Parvularculaceae bacterium]|nr:MBL fold metallo-hydrolase [Parvularculaceae bacterium]
MAGIPFVKDFDAAYGEAVVLSPLVRRVVANNPGPFTYAGSGTYLIGREGGPLAVIDPGPNDPSHLEALLRVIGSAPVEAILVTHTHRDHCALARAFAARVGAPILSGGAHPTRNPSADVPVMEEGADYAFAPDRIVEDDERITGDGWTIEAVSTPGHLSNHFCYALVEEKTLFTGDHIMGWSTTVVAPPDGNMGAYLASLDKLLARDDRLYLPTHGAPIAKPHRFVRAVRAHRRMRDGQILAQLKNGRSRINEIVPVLYADVDKRLHGAAALNVFAHLIRLVESGAVLTEGAPALGGAYRLAAR